MRPFRLTEMARRHEAWILNLVLAMVMSKQANGSSAPSSSTRKSLRLLPLLLSLLWLACAHGPEARARGRRPFQALSPPLQQSARPELEQDVMTLEPRKPVERELSGEQKHGYQLTLAEGQYARVVVEQRGIDLTVQLLGTDGKSIADFDVEIRIQGEEKIEVVSAAAGSYRLLVKARYPKLPAGRYEIRLIEARNATEEDRLLYEARRLEMASRQLWGAGKYAEALPPGEKALEMQERRWGTEHPELTYPLLNLAAINYFKGDYAKAQALCLRALTIAEKALGPEHWWVARLLHNLAAFYIPMEGGEARAEPLYQRAVAILEKALGPDHPLVATSLSELARIYRNRGDFVRTEQLLQRALTVHEKALGEEHSSLASTLNNLAGLYREKGDNAKAEQLYKRVLAIWEKTNPPYVAVALNNLAQVYSEMGDYERAEPLFERAISIKEKSLGPNHADVANSRGSLARMYYRRGDYAKAETLYQSALATMEKALGPNHQTVGLYLAILANLYFTTADYAKAEPLYHRALSILETAYGTNYYNLADILVELAQMSAAQGQIEQALAYQARANAIIEHNLALNLAVGSERQKLAYLARLPEQMNRAIALHTRFAANDLRARELAATSILQRKGRVQDALSNNLASLRNRFSSQDQALLDQLNVVISRLARLALKGPQGTSPADHQKQLKALEEQREKLESEISRRSAEFHVQSQPVTLAAIRAAIPDDAALIELAIYRPFDPNAKGTQAYGEPRYVVYVLRRQGEVRWKELGEAKSVDAAIDSWRKALRDPWRKDVRQLARAVDERVMRPIRALVGDATRLLVSPDGALNLIPFAALVDERGSYLVERYSLTYLTSGRDLLRLQVARESKSAPVVVADPAFGEPAVIASSLGAGRDAAAGERVQLDHSQVFFGPLPGVGAEVRALKELLPQATFLTRAQATKAALKRVRAPRILHIATHGFFLQNNPPVIDRVTQTEDTRQLSKLATNVENPLLRSGLALAGANQSVSGDDNGVLTAFEMAHLNLWGTKLVVLSACDTGIGEVKNGEGVYGLRRALVLAGTESQMVSLWPVSDSRTRDLMIGYYQALLQNQGRGEALRQVQLRMLSSKAHSHPYYWASFIQTGEWANLKGER